jgi:RNA polymerase primary sigma factor
LAEQARIVRLPLNQVGALNKMNKTFSRLEQNFEREPTPEELAKEMEIPEDKLADTIRVSGRHVSMDAPLLNAEENSLADLLINQDAPPSDHTLISESLKREIEHSLSTLTDREKDVVRLFYGLGEHPHGLTLEEIGAKFDLTRERVRQIKEKAIRRLRHSSRSKLLKAYLG